MACIFDESWPFVLGQGSMYERLRRDTRIEVDPHIFHAALIYGDAERDFLATTLKEYLDIGQQYGLPMFTCTPTWRASAERVALSRCSGLAVNRDAADFMKSVRASYGEAAHPIVLSALVGPKGDAYKPDEAPDRDAARRFHAPQIMELAAGELDCLEGKTLPSLDEALGMSDVFSETGQPYTLSFVLRPDGTILDGTPFGEVIDRIDNGVARAPEFYLVNCVHASVYQAAYQVIRRSHPEQASRLIGLEANTSALSPEELDALEDVAEESPEKFGREVSGLRASTGARYLGGCCGSGTEHIEALARAAAVPLTVA